MAASAGHEPFATLIIEQLTEERARKQSLEQRGLAVVTSSGTLVTLLFALAALVTKPDSFELPKDSKAFFGLAVAAFALAGILGIFTNKTLKYSEPSVDWMRLLTTPAIWNQVSSPVALRRATEARIESIASFREKNRLKVRLLSAAITCEVGAVGFVGIGIIKLFT